MRTRPDAALSELILLAVLADEALYGYAIAKRVAARSDDRLRLTPGVLYPLLKKLETAGYVSASWDAVRSDRAEEGSEGRRRKWYRLSAKGRRRLAQHAQAQREHLRLVAAFLPPEDPEPEASP